MKENISGIEMALCLEVTYNNNNNNNDVDNRMVGICGMSIY